MKTKRFFIAGTDTEIGKTTVSCALLNTLNSLNKKTIALKPIAAGAGYQGNPEQNDDAVLLSQHSSIKLNYCQVNPFLLKTPCSPHIAAEIENRLFDVTQLKTACMASLEIEHDIALIEGAGGWFCPVNKTETLADFAVNMQLEVILVVGLKLGCLNHALLTAKAIHNSGLKLAGWIANSLSDETPFEAENIDYLEHALPGPRLGSLGYHQPELTLSQAGEALFELFSSRISCAPASSDITEHISNS